MTAWQEAQKWEKKWHGDCVNSYNEETKQLIYAKYMGLKMTHNIKTPYTFNMKGQSIIDLGGGPYSLLLKCENFSYAVVVDPIDYPQWVIDRYYAKKIYYIQSPAEEMTSGERIFDEVWIYNVLQHTYNPQKILANALQLGKIIRIFEWIETGTSEGHLHNLTKNNLDNWLGGNGKADYVNQQGCRGNCYYGIFLGNHYEQ